MRTATAAPETDGIHQCPNGCRHLSCRDLHSTEAWVEEAYDLRHWTVMPKGGHFAALEQPEFYVNDLRDFYRLLR